jgi:hypothetical protein
MDEGMKVRDLLPDRLDGLGEETKKKLCKDKSVSAMSLAWDYIESQLDDELRDLLDMDVFEVLGKAWAGAKRLSEYRDKTKHPPGIRELLKFGDFDFERELHPVIEVTIGDCPCVDLNFTVKLGGHFSGLYLGIKDAHIIDGRSGKAWASAQVSCEEVPLHKEKETKKFVLPGTFKLTPPGIEIPSLV